MFRWWVELKDQLASVDNSNPTTNNVDVDLEGSLSAGKDTYISKDAKLKGNIVIGDNCMIGTNVVIRGNVRIGNNVRVGYGVEIKDSVIKDGTTIGPLCYIGNSLLEKNVYLGALVRTSNHRLDRVNINSWNGEFYEDTGTDKLGTWIKENSSLGIGVVILPGRIVPENSIFSPHIVITKNYPSGTFKLSQEIVKVK